MSANITVFVLGDNVWGGGSTYIDLVMGGVRECKHGSMNQSMRCSSIGCNHEVKEK
jgi:hypothetical protein